MWSAPAHDGPGAPAWPSHTPPFAADNHPEPLDRVSHTNAHLWARPSCTLPFDADNHPEPLDHVGQVKTHLWAPCGQGCNVTEMTLVSTAQIE